MFVDWWVILLWAMLHELMCSNIHVYVYISSISIFYAIMLNNIPQEAAHVSILTCMYDSNFADEVCHTFVDMSTELWTRGLGNVECISCCLMLQITYLGVYKCNLCPCVMCLHTPRMYFRLQPVCSISLCSSLFDKNGHKFSIFAAMNI